MWWIGRALALIGAALGASAAGVEAWGSGWVVALSVLLVPASLAALVTLGNGRGEFAPYLRWGASLVVLGALAAGLFFKQEVGDTALDFGGSFLLVAGWLLGWTALVGLLWFGRRSLVRDWGRR